MIFNRIMYYLWYSAVLFSFIMRSPVELLIFAGIMCIIYKLDLIKKEGR